MKHGNPFGLHRVIEPVGSLPQQADRIDNSMEIYDNEILIDVATLNIDSASFTQIKEACAGDEQKIRAMILDIVNRRGKMQNPVTGSGGMLMGRIAQIGPTLTGATHAGLRVGDRIATLVSLSLTPLSIASIGAIRIDTDQVDVDAQAILFESGIFAVLPDDMADTLSLAVLDVAGAPAQTARLVRPGDTVLIIGAGGKSGLLCLHEARKRAGVTGTVVAFSHSDGGIARVKESGLADIILQGDATKPVELYERFTDALAEYRGVAARGVVAGAVAARDDQLADIVINNVNIPNTEMASILCTRDHGTIYFFSMATSFTKAALGAEGVGKDIQMIIGNGYAKDHAAIALQVLRENDILKSMFTRLYT
ncbi:MAG: L-erythro-3,5-diaminohexanoate dehydrogenase [Spirochaetaceae bacterium]|nr:MAG: L-erythro-3,5-diaminohexanoate dehydrogenase [Spirochaetaceae bacterium]